MKTLGVYLSIGVLALIVTACGDRLATPTAPDSRTLPIVSGKLSEVAPPPLISELRQSLDRYSPQVAILSPTADQLFVDTKVKVELQVTDLPVFQDPELGLGPHLALILDNEPAREIHDPGQPVTLENLSPGTHTLQVFASRPWNESFKNDGAYARTTFHVITKTSSNAPDPKLPLLTYNRPQGVYGAQPVLLDFYLANAPLHLVAKADESDEIEDWRVRVTVNGESFLLDTWEPIYLQGFEKGDNLVKLEFIDEKGDVVENVFNTTARLITYDPNHEDSLTKLVKGELSPSIARKIVDPNYTAIPVIEKPPIVEEEAAPVREAEDIPESIAKPTAETDTGKLSEPIALPRLELPEEVEPAATSPEIRTLELPELVLPPETARIETPAIEPLELPRLVLPELGKVTTPEPIELPEPVLPKQTKVTALPAIEPPVGSEGKPEGKPAPEKGNPWLDRVRDTFSRWQSARGSDSEPVLDPDEPPADAP